MLPGHASVRAAVRRTGRSGYPTESVEAHLNGAKNVDIDFRGYTTRNWPYILTYSVEAKKVQFLPSRIKQERDKLVEIHSALAKRQVGRPLRLRHDSGCSGCQHRPRRRPRMSRARSKITAAR